MSEHGNNGLHNEVAGAETIGARIRTYRADRSLSLSALAAQAGVSKSYLSTVESGTGSRPGAAVLHKLAVAMGVTLADLLGREVRPQGDLGVPGSLAEFAEERGLPQADVEMLAAIAFRGEQPKSRQRWEFIYNAITASTGMDERN